MNLEQCRIVQLPKVSDPRGNLTFLEGGTHVPFSIARVFYLYDVPGGSERAGHALRSCEQFLIAMSGSSLLVTVNALRARRRGADRAPLPAASSEGLTPSPYSP